ncbi:hypothetical protein [Methanosarcina siciliae]|uniref:hypothetical protein n=1 Tax=Methanosarcina siciliae TaxID=38027 RepID=UPI00064E9FF7|nr:hypothetical protein [Methanosarcina siciliae]
MGIHNYKDNSLKRAELRIREAEYHEENKNLILLFENFLFAEPHGGGFEKGVFKGKSNFAPFGFYDRFWGIIRNICSYYLYLSLLKLREIATGNLQ